MKTDFLMAPAYSGGVVNFLFWGPTVIDLAGNGLRKSAVLPALRQHQPDRNVGIIDRTYPQDQALHAEGRFFESSADGREVAALAREGYPWQASISFWPETIENFDKGESVTVNGRRLQGPLVVVRKAHLREISFVGLGLDPDTAVMPMSAPALQAAVRSEWEGNPGLRAEFNGDFGCYQAYRRAEAAGWLDSPATGGNAPSVGGAEMADQAAVRAEWEGNPGLRAEFYGDFGSYQAYRRAEAAGQTRMFTPKTVVQT